MEVCCFDKTGTLTSDHMLLEGVAGVPGHGKEELLPGALPASVAQVLASCHALVQVSAPAPARGPGRVAGGNRVHGCRPL